MEGKIEENFIKKKSLKVEGDLKKIYNDNITDDLALKYSYSIINNISKQYNLDSIQNIALFLNYDNLFDEYGFYKVTIDDDLSIKQDKMGITYTHMISEQGINHLKLLVNNNMELNINCYNCFCLENNPIFCLNLREYLEEFSNVTVEDITKLGIYLNDLELIHKYLKLLNNCDEDIKKMILDYIKPLIFYDDYEEDILNIFGISTDTGELQKMFKLIPKKEEFMKYVKQYIKDKKFTQTKKIFNFVFLTEFNDYYTKQYNLIYKLLKKDNSKNILGKLLSIKYESIKSIPNATVMISKKAIYKEESYDVYDGDCWGNDHECAYYSTHTVNEIVFAGYEYTTRFNFNKERIVNEKEALNILLPMVANEEYDYKKLLESNYGEYINLFLNFKGFEEKEKVLCK